MIKELDVLSRLGFSGNIFIVDDNFIGNKVNVTRQLLPALIEWNQQNGYPFYYTTEASLNLMDDDALMTQMCEAEFRNVFFGIETPDPEVLRRTQKKQNAFRPIRDRIHKLYDHGMVAYAGFILGLDGEKERMDQAMIQLIEDTCINFAMVGFLVALPNTQLTKRLLREGRLLSFRLEPIENEEQMLGSADANQSVAPLVDQAINGLNFRTQRERLEIMQDYLNVIRAVYEPTSYFDRVLRLIGLLKVRSRHRPRWFEIKRDLLGFVRMALTFSRDKRTRPLFWRNVCAALAKGPVVLAAIMHLMAGFVHFQRHARYTLDAIKQQMPIATEMERKLAEHDRAKQEQNAG
jgi:radical SAM superfamily enzyme YgiQ (UPF0313 family)